MRPIIFPISLLLLLTTLTTALALSFSPAEEAGADAASGEAAGESAAGESGSNVGESSTEGTNGETGCTIYSCPNDNNNDNEGSGATNPDNDVVPGSSSSSNGGGGTDGSDNDGEEENAHAASEIIEHINDIIDDISSLLSLAISTSDSSTFTLTRPTASPLPTAASQCLSAQSIYSACGRSDNSGGQNFTTLSVSQQASCLCYQRFGGSSSGDNKATTTVTWVPGLFDGYVSSCNGFIATQSIVALTTSTSASTTTGICASVGDVRASPGSTTQAVASTSTMSSNGAAMASSTTMTTAPMTGLAGRSVRRRDGVILLSLVVMAGGMIGFV